MTVLQLDAWPPEPVSTDRLVIRPAQASDRPFLIALLTSADARRHLGGPLTHQEAEAATSGTPGRTPGSFVVTRSSDSLVIGTVGLDRRSADRPGQPIDANPVDGHQRLEVSYVLDPAHWGRGYATEAVAAVLAWATGALPDTDVVACTQSANTPSITLLQRLGFTEIDQFVEFDAAQTLWIRALDMSDAPAASR